MTIQLEESATGVDQLPLKRIDYVEFWVGNAKQACYYYQQLLGLDLVAYRGLETKSREVCSYVLERDKIRLVLSTPLNSQHPMNAHLTQHGDGVQCIAFEVDDAKKSFEVAVSRGAVPVEEPHTIPGEEGQGQEQGQVVVASIKTYGDTVHRFVQRTGFTGNFLPGFQKKFQAGPDHGLVAVDHMVGNVELGKMDYWVNYYAKILGFSQLKHFDDKDISTEYSALMSKVMQDGTGKIKFPINEPADGRRKSQIEEYLDYYGSPGVQHVALLTGDILKTVTAMRAAGMEFLRVPSTYYSELPNRVGPIKEEIAVLQDLGILVDRDDEGYLLQIFTRPVQDRPTVFFEIIQRRGSRGFGKGNFKALFEAIEREQASRGNL